MGNIPRSMVLVCWAVMLTVLPACATAGVGFARELEQLDREHGQLVTVSEIGRSVDGRAIAMVQLAAGPREPDDRPAMLIVAGMDGDMPVSTTVSLAVVDRLAKRYAEGDADVRTFLDQHTLYVLPRMNPDGQELSVASPTREFVLNRRPVDDDRDGQVDEDGPDDLNGDGMITMMRARDPEGVWLADAGEPRLLRKADRNKGEVPIYKVYVEGTDNDGDGYYNEDPVGGVDLNANFMHAYQEHGEYAGPHQISEPESWALIEFVLNHPRIGIVLTIGRHNNLVKVNGGEKKDDTGKAPKGLHEDDVAIYKHVADRFKELTEIDKSPEASANGAFYAWAYAQHGVPSFATTVWQRPAKKKPDEKEGENEPDGDDESDGDDDEKEPKDGRKKKKKDKDKKDESFEQDLGWLTFSDEQRGGDGFVDWGSFDHPTLGSVEIGGFVPMFRNTLQSEDVEAVAGRHADFVVDLAGKFPSVQVTKTSVKQLGESLFEIEFGLTNSGYFPTGLAIATLNRQVKPMVVTLDVDRDRIVGGEKTHKVRRIEGSGGFREFRWIVKGEAGETIVVRCRSRKLGDFEQPITLKETVQR